jgi:hypothetical protein
MWYSRAVLQNESRRVEAEWNKIERDSRAHRMHVGKYLYHSDELKPYASARKWQEDRSTVDD